MRGKNDDSPSAEQIAKVNRQRLAREDGARALEDAAKQATAVRKNMARLRELRLNKEAEEDRQQPLAEPKKRS
jgi:hypothetical protein